MKPHKIYRISCTVVQHHVKLDLCDDDDGDEGDDIKMLA